MTIRQNIQWIIFKYLKDNPSHKVRDRLIEKYPFYNLGSYKSHKCNAAVRDNVAYAAILIYWCAGRSSGARLCLMKVLSTSMRGIIIKTTHT